MREAGLLLKFEEMNKLPDKCAESRKRLVTSHALRIPEISASFLILGVGIITSIFVFYLEYSWPCGRKITTKIKTCDGCHENQLNETTNMYNSDIFNRTKYFTGGIYRTGTSDKFRIKTRKSEIVIG